VSNLFSCLFIFDVVQITDMIESFLCSIKFG